MGSQARFVALLLFGFAACSIDVSAQSWRKHVYRPDNFETEFSGEVMVRPSQISEAAKERIVRSTHYIQDGGSFKYMVTAALTKSGVDLEKGAEAGFASYRCQTLLGKTALDLPGAKGREMRGTGCENGFQVDARYYEAGKWFYQVIAQYKAGGEKSARRFLQAFKIVGQ